MTISISGYDQINNVAIIDDKEEARDAIAETIQDADLVPVPYTSNLGPLLDFIDLVLKETEAAVFDHHLKPGNYASFNGAEAVAVLYKKNSQHF